MKNRLEKRDEILPNCYDFWTNCNKFFLTVFCENNKIQGGAMGAFALLYAKKPRKRTFVRDAAL